MGDPISFGRRLERLRREHGMTREHLAAEVGISPETVKAIENGKRAPRHQMLLRLAAALGGQEALGELVGIPAGAPDRDPSVLAIRDVIQSPASVGALPDDQDAPLAPAQVRAGTAAGYAAYWAGDFARLAGMLPDLILSARVARDRGAPGMAEPLALARDLAAAVLVHLGEEDLALVAAGLAVQAAAGGDDELLHAAMRGTCAWVMLHQGRFADSEKVAAAAAAAAGEVRDGRAGRRDAARGVLLMTAVGPAAVAGRDVAGYIAEAAALAAGLGGPVTAWGTSFSAASVRMQAVYAYAVRREPGRALRAAGQVRPLEDLPGTISRGRHLLDIAQAHVDAGHWGEATGILAQARRMAPEWFSRQEAARLLTGEILDRKTRLSEPLKDLAASFGGGREARYFRAAGLTGHAWPVTRR
jgi:transcriptional regulator with XRE-family HTH domain